MKNRVLQFFLLLVLLVVLLTVLHFLRFGGLTGFAVSEAGVSPSIQFVAPTEATDTTIDRNNILINVTALDGDGDLKNISIQLYNSTLDRINFTFSDTSPFFLNFTDLADGLYYFNATAFDYADNRNDIETRSVTLDTTIPLEITILSPLDQIYTTSQIDFNVTTNEESVAANYSLDSDGINVAMIAHNSTNFGDTNESLADGQYTVTFYASDSSGEVGSDSVNFRVVVEGVFLEISKPTGAKDGDSWKGTAKYTAYGNDCNYRVEYVEGGDVVTGAEGSIANCQGEGEVEFKVFADDNYVFFLEAKNSSGMTESISSEFSVTAFSGSSGSGDSGSEGSDSDSESGSALTGAVIAEQSINLRFSDLSEVSVRGGEVSTMNIEVENADTRSLNDCVLFSEGTLAAWVKSQVRGFDPGEKSNYEFLLSAPEGTEPGVYSGNLVVECTEGRAEKEIQVSVSSDSFGVEILDYERVGNILRVSYTLEEFASATHELILLYELVDFDGVVRTSGQEELVLGAENSTDNVLEFDLPKDSFGEFDFRLILDDGASVVATNKTIFLSSEGITGLAVSDTNRRVLSIAGIVILVGIIVFFGWRYYPKWGPEVKNLFDKFGSKKKSDSSFVKLGF